MADDGTDEGTAEGDPVDEAAAIQELLDTEIEFVERVPLAAVPIRLGNLSTVAVVCSDGAVFKRTLDDKWLELEPVPGTPRAESWEAE